MTLKGRAGSNFMPPVRGENRLRTSVSGLVVRSFAGADKGVLGEVLGVLD